MIPSTLWLLRANRRVLFAGAAATIVGFLAIGTCLLWLKHQPHTTPGTYEVSNVPWLPILSTLLRFFLEFPFLLLPVSGLFLLVLPKSKLRIIVPICGAVGIFIFLATYPSHLRGSFSSFLEPTLGMRGSDFVTIYGGYESLSQGTPHLFLPIWVQGLMTAVSLGGVVGLVLSCFATRRPKEVVPETVSISWSQLGILLGPFAAAYTGLLIYRALAVANDHSGWVFDRYSLGLLLVVLICLVRLLQDRVESRFSPWGFVFIAIMAVYGVAFTHNTFTLDRARVAMAAELRAAHVPDTSVDNGWEYNLLVELQHTPFIQYIPRPPVPADTCTMVLGNNFPHIHPLYGVSFEPSICAGPAPFPPIHYSRWLASEPGTLYVVRYTDGSAP
jgi:hypothetical protein